MRDYDYGEGLSEDEIYMSLTVAEEDPFFFEDAVKERKWRHAMDEEIMSIKKNKTWTLVDLPTDAKKIGVK